MTSAPVVTIDDIAGVINAVLEANDGYQASVPGDTEFERAPDTPEAYPYGVYHVEAEEARLCFDGVYFQSFTVSLAVYVPQGEESSPQDATSVQQAIHAALASEDGEAAVKAQAMRNSTERIMHCKLKLPAGQYDHTLRDGKDVFMCGLTVSIMVQGDRSVS